MDNKRIIAPSEMIINPDGSIFHLHLLPEQLTDRTILAGDPARVNMVASFFDTKTFEVSNREFHTIGGTYGGKRVSAEPMTDYQSIDNIITLLKKITQNHRNGKQQHRLDDRSFC